MYRNRKKRGLLAYLLSVCMLLTVLASYCPAVSAKKPAEKYSRVYNEANYQNPFDDQKIIVALKNGIKKLPKLDLTDNDMDSEDYLTSIKTAKENGKILKKE